MVIHGIRHEPICRHEFREHGQSQQNPHSFYNGKDILRNIPETIAFAYYQYVIMAKGPDGTVLAEDAVNAPTIIAGTCGQGRVIGIGALIAGWEGVKKPEVDLLARCIQWTSEKTALGEGPEQTAALLRKTRGELLILRKSFEKLSAETKEQTDDLYNQLQYMKYGGKIVNRRGDNGNE